MFQKQGVRIEPYSSIHYKPTTRRHGSVGVVLQFGVFCELAYPITWVKVTAYTQLLLQTKLLLQTTIAKLHYKQLTQIVVMKYLAQHNLIVCIFYVICTQDTKAHGSWILLVICYRRLNCCAQCNNMNVTWKGLVYCHSDFGWLILIF